jgi:hypothetical protein
VIIFVNFSFALFTPPSRRLSDPNEDDLLSSQELEEFAKDMEEDQTDFQSKIGAMISIPPMMRFFMMGKVKSLWTCPLTL